MHSNRQPKRKFNQSIDEFDPPDKCYISTTFKNEHITAPKKQSKSHHHNIDWRSFLSAIENPSSSDTIRECCGVDLESIVTGADKYFCLADQKLHIFPFKDVHPCWHRLYTDTSIVKALNILRQSETETTKSLTTCVNEAIRLLDSAMITTGAHGRTEMMANIYTQIELLLEDSMNESSAMRGRTTLELLPTQEHSVPKLRNPVEKSFYKPTLTTFEKAIHEVKEPVLLTGILDTWPAIEHWKSKAYWERITLQGRRLVPIEVGRSYIDDEWSQQIITFQDFLDTHIMNEDDSKGYLAQYDLFHHLPQLNKDIAIPDYCFLDAPPPDPETPVAKAKMKGGLKSAKLVDGEVLKNIWFGPAWTISPLHHDPYHNILCQVVGKKYIRLYSPKLSDKLHPRSEEEPAPHGSGTIDMSNTSSIDIGAIETSPEEDWDEQWPGISQVPYQEIILEAGQALYIPVGWWHYVRSCSVGISVSFWWS